MYIYSHVYRYVLRGASAFRFLAPLLSPFPSLPRSPSSRFARCPRITSSVHQPRRVCMRACVLVCVRACMRRPGSQHCRQFIVAPTRSGHSEHIYSVRTTPAKVKSAIIPVLRKITINFLCKWSQSDEILKPVGVWSCVINCNYSS